MANTKSASKRSRQTAVRSLRNRTVRTRLRKMNKSLAGGTGSKDETSTRHLISAVDKAAKRGIIHRNAANRRKARLNRGRMAGQSSASSASTPKASVA